MQKTEQLKLGLKELFFLNKIKKVVFIFIICFSHFLIEAQNYVPFKNNNKWGFKINDKVIIEPQYDTVFNFNNSNKIALVANIGFFEKVVNPLTGAEELSYQYYFVNGNNEKLKLKVENYPDSVSTLGFQYEFQNQYLDSSNFFKVLFDEKVYLVSKNGKQISKGYDNITKSSFLNLFLVENNILVDNKMVKKIGVIDTTGKLIVKCNYKHVVFNDSIIYCCSAINRAKQKDEVFDLNGRQLYASENHIEYASKNCVVTHQFEPKEWFTIINTKADKQKNVEGNLMYKLDLTKALIVGDKDWYIINLTTLESKKVDKRKYYKLLMFLTTINE